jgi:hypothetical protein
MSSSSNDMFIPKQFMSSGRITSSLRGWYRVVTIALSFSFSGIASTALCDSDLEAQDSYSNGPGFFRRAGDLGIVVDKSHLSFLPNRLLRVFYFHLFYQCFLFIYLWSLQWVLRTLCAYLINGTLFY